jgi:hypothetical protein
MQEWITQQARLAKKSSSWNYVVASNLVYFLVHLYHCRSSYPSRGGAPSE